MNANIAASIHARLLNRAKMRGEEFNLVLTRYAIERFLYRLSTLPSHVKPVKQPICSRYVTI